MVKKEVLVLFFTFYLVKVNSTMIGKMKNLECFADKDWWFNLTCSLKAINWKKSLINIDSVLKQDFKTIRVQAQVFKRFNSWQPFPLKANFELCIVLGRSVNYFFERVLRKLFIDYTTLNHTCPYLKGEKLLARDLDWQSTDVMKFPLAGGAGRYRLDLKLFGNGAKTKPALTVIGHADVTEEL